MNNVETYQTPTITDDESKPLEIGYENETVDPWALPKFERIGPKWQGDFTVFEFWRNI